MVNWTSSIHIYIYNKAYTFEAFTKTRLNVPPLEHKRNEFILFFININKSSSCVREKISFYPAQHLRQRENESSKLIYKINESATPPLVRATKWSDKRLEFDALQRGLFFFFFYVIISRSTNIFLLVLPLRNFIIERTTSRTFVRVPTVLSPSIKNYFYFYYYYHGYFLLLLTR